MLATGEVHFVFLGVGDGHEKTGVSKFGHFGGVL
jgi:hypothetical protein